MIDQKKGNLLIRDVEKIVDILTEKISSSFKPSLHRFFYRNTDICRTEGEKP